MRSQASTSGNVGEEHDLIGVRLVASGRRRWPGAGPVDLPSAGCAERPDHQHGLEEEADESFGVGVEPERVDTLGPLRDVAGEDDDEERGDDGADDHPVAGQPDERRAERDLDDAGGDHDEVLVDRKPFRDLRAELAALSGEVTDPGADQRSAEEPAQHRAHSDAIARSSGVGHGAMVRPPGDRAGCRYSRTYRSRMLAVTFATAGSAARPKTQSVVPTTTTSPPPSGYGVLTIITELP